MDCKTDRRRTVDKKLSDIDDMIRRENDEEKRNVLLVLHCITSTLCSTAKVLEELEVQHRSRIDLTEAAIERHDKIVDRGVILWQLTTWILGPLQIAVLAGFGYGYNLIADLRDTVNRHEVMYISEATRIHSPSTDTPQKTPNSGG